MESQETNIRILKHETTILNHLYRNGCRCIPMVYWFGVHFENTCLIMNFYKDSVQMSKEVDFYKLGRSVYNKLSKKKFDKILTNAKAGTP